jgi:hypothetical protein
LHIPIFCHTFSYLPHPLFVEKRFPFIAAVDNEIIVPFFLNYSLLLSISWVKSFIYST